MGRNERLWLCLGLLLALAVQVAVAKPGIHIPDELDDVEDNEEDDDWKQWGKTKGKEQPFNPLSDPPEDPRELEQYQLEMMKRATGTSMGFVKLRLGVQRSAEEASRIAEKWTSRGEGFCVESRRPVGAKLWLYMSTKGRSDDPPPELCT
jgi:hypothetical protein